MACSDSERAEKRPPKPVRTKRRRKARREPLNTVAFIDQLLLTQIAITREGEIKKVTALEAIMLQLLNAEKEGNAGASKVLRKYRALVSRKADARPQVVFVENNYTRSFAGGKGDPNG